MLALCLAPIVIKPDKDVTGLCSDFVEIIDPFLVSPAVNAVIPVRKRNLCIFDLSVLNDGIEEMAVYGSRTVTAPSVLVLIALDAAVVDTYAVELLSVA